MELHDDGRRLHDRATRGEPLTAEERVILDKWYARRDAAEEAVLSANLASPTIELRRRVEDALKEITQRSSEIQRLLSENEQLQRENSALAQRLAHRHAKQAT